MDPISQQLVMGAAGSGGSEKLYVEDVFSTWLYTGNGSTQTITNGIDLSGKGGLVWIKSRSSGATYYDHVFCDTVRGNTKYLASSGSLATSGQQTGSGGTNDITSFNSNGFSLGTDSAFYKNTGASTTYASWTFRKAAKFFDVVTYTGSGSAGKVINHNLGSAPGVIILKRTDASADWVFWHRTFNGSQYLYLNTTNSLFNDSPVVNFSNVGSSSFQIDSTWASTNASGGTYVAYLFAHDAGGFGASGNDSVVSCGSYVGNGSTNGPSIDLGWEPQWLLIKNASAVYSWYLYDSARTVEYLNPNLLTAGAVFSSLSYTPSGFKIISNLGDFNTSGGTYIYIAIRRGPMKTPTDATKVFNAISRAGTSADASVTCGFQADAWLVKRSGPASNDCAVFTPRLTEQGGVPFDNTFGETNFVSSNPWDRMDGIRINTTNSTVNGSNNNYINYLFKRSPGFLDIVTYKGTGAARTISHNLGVVPELMLVRARFGGYDWQVYAGSPTEYLIATTTATKVTSNTDRWNSTSPTSSVFSLGTSSNVNGNTVDYIAYLFASCPGISKIGTYTGTGSTININCGFTGGARFVLIKGIDIATDWFYWDTARGIVAADEPYLRLNRVNPEVAGFDWIDPLSSGFQVTSASLSDINASGSNYLYLAIA